MILPPSLATAQQSADFWQDLTSAAAQEKLESPVTPILLGHALKIAERDDPNGARAMLTRTQLLISYVFIDQFDLFKKTYGLAPINVDISKFDKALANYIPTAAFLRGLYYDRWTQPRDSDDDLRTAAVGIAALRLSEVEVPLRGKFARQDTLDLADALVNQGLIYNKSDEPKLAAEDYQAALDLFAATRRDRHAVDRVDRAFDFAGSRPSDTKRVGVAEPQGSAEDFVAAPTEPFLPITIITATLPSAEAAIANGDAAGARGDLEIMRQADAQSARISHFVLTNWPCHADLAQIYFWRGALDGARLRFSNKFGQPASDENGSILSRADTEFRTALAIDYYSAGILAPDFKAIVERYRQFLTETGNRGDAARLDENIKSLDPAVIGETGPPDWRSVLDCSARSR